mgnify:CR=1 FL=1
MGTTGDGCEPITSNVVGKVALMDRGNCGFAIKAKNAQNAGASAVVIADNVAGFRKNLQFNTGMENQVMGPILKKTKPNTAARDYLKRIEGLCDVPIDLISTGPERDETIVLRHPFA